MNRGFSVNVNGKNLNFKVNSLRALFQYEEMTGKSSSAIASLEENIQMIYCILNASNKEEDFSYSYDEFITLIEDSDEDILGQFTAFFEKK